MICNPSPIQKSTKIATSTRSTKTPRSAKSLVVGFHYGTKCIRQTRDTQLRASPFTSSRFPGLSGHIATIGTFQYPRCLLPLSILGTIGDWPPGSTSLWLPCLSATAQPLRTARHFLRAAVRVLCTSHCHRSDCSFCAPCHTLRRFSLFLGP